ncbi:MAG: TadE/TadG family type IV pilus assembly protein [Elusimicrobiota bacterium]
MKNKRAIILPDWTPRPPRLMARRGQILIPALFVFPSLMLFIWLIYETAKLSQMKIRRQFAVDAAAFVEMTNYSDFLNRSAYVNGAFPMRIFSEVFPPDQEVSCGGRSVPGGGHSCQGNVPLYDIFYQEGVFPRSLQESGGNGGAEDPTYDPTTETTSDYSQDQGTWDIGYGGIAGSNGPNDKNVENPNIPGDTPDDKSGGTPPPPWDPDTLVLFRLRAASYWDLRFDDMKTIYGLYVQIYQLLGSVESAQFSVLKRLAGQHNFLTKSYWLNTGDPQSAAEAQMLSSSFDQSAGSFLSDVNFQCAPKIGFCGGVLTHTLIGADYPPNCWQGSIPSNISDCPSGIFQLVTVNKDILESMDDRNSAGSGGGGWPVQVSWTPPSNYFNVPFTQIMGAGGPIVHARIALWMGKTGGSSDCQGETSGSASVWPCPTPHFQVREYP